MSRVSTFASNSLLLQQTLRTQQRVFDGQIAISSEKKSQTYDGIFADSRRLVNVENTNSLLQRYITNNQQMDVNLGISDTAITGIGDTLKDFKSQLILFESGSLKSEEDTTSLQTSAFNALKSVEALLNTDVDGRFLFAGGRGSTQPVSLGLTDLSAFQAKYDGATIEYPTNRDMHLDQLSASKDSVTGLPNWLTFENDAAVSSQVTASAGASAGEILLTGKAPGNSYTMTTATPTTGTTLDNTSSSTNTATPVLTTSQQIDLVTVAGTVEAGDQYTITVDGNAVTYTVNGTEASIADVRTGLATAINADATMSALVTAKNGTANGELILTGVTSGDRFTTVMTTPTQGTTTDNTALSTTTTTANGLTVAQVDTATLAGTKDNGDQFRVTINGNTVTYTVTAGDADIDAVRNGLVSAVNADSTMGAFVTAAAGANTGELTFTAKVPGETFTTTMSIPTDGGVANTATSVNTINPDVVKTSQLDTVTIAGTVEAGDQYTVTVNGTSVTYTVTAGDTTISDVRTGLRTAINANGTLNAVITAADSATNSQLTLTAKTPGDAFTSSATVPTSGTTVDNAATSVVTTANLFTMAQQDLVTLAGTVEAGDQYQATINGTSVTYTVTGAETGIADIRAGLVAAINANGTLGPLVTATASQQNGDLTITADDAAFTFTTSLQTPTTGTTTDNTATSVTRNNIITTAQVDTAIIAGTVEIGDQYTVSVDGNSITYTVSASDKSLANIRAGIVSAINGNPAMSAVVEAGAGTVDGEFTLIGKTRGKAFKTTLTTPSTGTTADNTATFAKTTTSSIQIAQTDTMTIAGSVEVGDVYTLDIDGVKATYTVTGSETGLSDIRDGLIAAINSEVNEGVSRVTSTSAEFSGLTAGAIFTVSGTVGGLNDGLYKIANVSSDGKTLDIVSRQLATAPAAVGTIEFENISDGSSRVIADDTALAFTRTSGTNPDKISYTNELFDSVSMGQKITVSNASLAANNGTYTVTGIDTVSNTILVETQRFSDQGSLATPFFSKTASSNSTIFTDGGTASDTITSTTAGFFSGLSQGMAVSVNNSTVNDGTYIVGSVSTDGKTVTLASGTKLPVGTGGSGVADSRTPSFEVIQTTGSIGVQSYYHGDMTAQTHKVNQNSSFALDLNAVDPAFEKAIRGLAIIAQGKFASEGGLDQNEGRIDSVISLLDGTINRTTTNKSPFGVRETAGSLQQVQIDLGYKRVLIKDTNELSTRFSSFLKTGIADMENIDITEAITKMLDDQQALEASFQVFAKIKQLSLTNFL